MNSLEDELRQELLDVSEQAQKLNYYPTRFIQMIHEQGALATARSLLKDSSIQTGLFRLQQLKALDLSLEAQVMKPKYIDLFTSEERRSARERLEKLDWKP